MTTNIAWHPSRYLLAYASEQTEDRSARDADVCVRLFGPGVLPQIQYSLYTNYCDIGFQLSADGKRLIVVSG